LLTNDFADKTLRSQKNKIATVSTSAFIWQVVSELTCQRNVLSVNRLVNEMICQRNVLSANWFVSEAFSYLYG